MFKNDKYKLDVIRKGDKHNSLTDYQDMIGSNAVPLYFEEGKRGYFVYETKNGDEFDKWHRIYTSEVELVTEDMSGLTVETANTYYYFVKELKEVNGKRKESIG